VSTLGARLVSLAVGVATALVIVAAAILPFLTPQWVAFEQGRAQAAAWTGYAEADLRSATDAILADLVIGPPDFDVTVGDRPVLEERERAHMRDVRNVFAGFAGVALVSAVVLAVAGWRWRDRARLWRAVRRGASVLAVAVVALGLVALVAFDSLFETFHEVFFPPGSYLFDPRTDRLVQLFPFQFWQETAIAVGLVIVGLCVVVAWISRHRERRVADVVAVAGSAASAAASATPG